jgi:hypothetical protein
LILPPGYPQCHPSELVLQLLSVPCQNMPISTMTPVSPGAPTPGQPARMSSISSHVPQLRFLLLPSLTRNYLTAHMRQPRPHLCPKAKHELTCPRQIYSVYLGNRRPAFKPVPCRLPTQSTRTQLPDLAGLFYHADWASLPRSAQLWCSHWPIPQFCAIYGRVCMWIGRVSCACAEWSSSIGTFSPIFDRIVVAPCSSPCPCLP